ncbi:hypothetical protein AAG570_007244 [Ranatra chinensis]|uniref:Uncharacterized protein n=1 Tax=Ranatra chinensis TaxID=642074 RepID=A0ABD0YAH8_9HEMI
MRGDVFFNFYFVFQSQRLYWCDLKTIVRIFYNGTGREVILDSGTASPFALAYHQDIVYWIDRTGDKGFMKAVQVSESVVGRRAATLTLGDDLGSTKDIAVFSVGRQRGTNPCAEDDGGCEELCLYDGKRPVCACPGRTVGPDGKNCAGGSTYLHRRTSHENAPMRLQ